MRSRFEHLRVEAIALRKQGNSIRDIEVRLTIPRSTLSGWFRGLSLSKKQQETLDKRHAQGLIKARERAAESHKAAKLERIEKIKKDALHTLKELPGSGPTLEIALAMLYLGEGGKTHHGLRLGNSNPAIMDFYLKSLETAFGVCREPLHYALHLRADQDEQAEKRFWSEALKVPVTSFTYVIKDPRTAGKSTYSDYHGVCLVSGGPVEIQRKLMYLAEAFMERLCAISSFG